MKIKIFPTFLIISLLIIFIIFYKGLQNPNIYTPNTNIEKNIPIFETKIFDSEDTVNSKNFFLDNKFYLLNIWASWCVPCRNEHSFLISLSKKRDIEIIGLNYKDNIKNAKNFIRELGNPYSVIFLDLDGTISIEWGAYGVPETFLIYDKKIIKKIIGPINDDSFAEIEKLIK
tara:strand:- start:628 stop:1146 length:519 start_codon:yes stop_codon:yes gene_type:complete